MRHFDFGKLECLTDEGVLNLVDRVDSLHLGVLDDELWYKRLMERDVNVFVDRGRDDKSAVFAIIRRQICAATSQRYSERTSGNNHRPDISYTLSTTRRAAFASDRLLAGGRRFRISSTN